MRIRELTGAGRRGQAQEEEARESRAGGGGRPGGGPPGAAAVAPGERAKALERACKEIERSFGKGALQSMSAAAVCSMPTLPTGSAALDLALGAGGYPFGRMVEVYGPESSGKTTLALHAVAECQRIGGTCAFVDAEHALDATYAARLGVRVEDLLVSQPDHGEQALQIVETLVRSQAVDLVVVDSVAALVPRAEVEGEIGDAHVGLQARLMSQALRKIGGAIHQAGAIVLFINQTRQKIGVTFGPTTTTTGGHALRFYASVRLEVRRIATLKAGEDAVGNRTVVKVAKNKVAPPFKSAEVDILYGRGFNVAGELLDLGVAAGLIDKSGAWFSVGEERLGQGRDRAAAALMGSGATRDRIRAALYGAAGLKPPALAPWSADPRSEASAETVCAAATGAEPETEAVAEAA